MGNLQSLWRQGLKHGEVRVDHNSKFFTGFDWRSYKRSHLCTWPLMLSCVVGCILCAAYVGLCVGVHPDLKFLKLKSWYLGGTENSPPSFGVFPTVYGGFRNEHGRALKEFYEPGRYSKD